MIVGRDSAAVARLDVSFFRHALAAADSGAVAGFVRLGDSLIVPIAAPVRDAGRIIGQVVQWRQVVSSAARRPQMLDLIGSQSGLYLGTEGPAAVRRVGEAGDAETALTLPAQMQAIDPC